MGVVKVDASLKLGLVDCGFRHSNQEGVDVTKDRQREKQTNDAHENRYPQIEAQGLSG